MTEHGFLHSHWFMKSHWHSARVGRNIEILADIMKF
uniref:Uncharacterized protein n=1 Tax=Anguilla anguilla TaxID=7936 RepID=A0A0E9VZ07_ANGAN